MLSVAIFMLRVAVFMLSVAIFMLSVAIFMLSVAISLSTSFQNICKYLKQPLNFIKAFFLFELDFGFRITEQICAAVRKGPL